MSTHGSENPTRATLAVLLAKAAVEEGHDVKVVFMGDAGVNIRDEVIDNIKGMGFPPYRDLFDFLVESKVQFFV
jgi:uncharacterized protein involved in oxidation of intracellular sulfur